MTCEQCGNDFFNSRIIEKEGVKYKVCPYCGWKHELKYNKKKGGKHYGQRNRDSK